MIRSPYISAAGAEATWRHLLTGFQANSIANDVRNLNKLKYLILERKLVMENRPPEKEFRAGLVKASVWENEKQNDKGDTVTYFSVKIEKSYKTKDDKGNDIWKTSNTYFREDIPKLQLVAAKAFEYIALTESKEETLPV